MASHHNNNEREAASIDGEEALQDLAHLEELHQEAERMKALGNKHMAAQVQCISVRSYKHIDNWMLFLFNC